MTPTTCHWTSVYTSCMPGVGRSMSTHEWLGIIMVIENQAAPWYVCLLPVYALVSGMHVSVLLKGLSMYASPKANCYSRTRDKLV